MASSTRRFLISRPGAESCSWTIRWRAAEKSGSTAGCELPTARRIACRRHSGRIAPHIGGKIRVLDCHFLAFLATRPDLALIFRTASDLAILGLTQLGTDGSL